MSFSKELASFIFLIALTVQIQAQKTLNKTLMHDGIQRSYILYIPANYTGDEAVPLVLNFHGYGSNANGQMNYGNFRPIADTAGFIIVHPQGTLLEGRTHWNVGGWTNASTTDDVGFTALLIETLATDYPIDRDRVYSTGMSNGGFMSFLLACQLSDKIAAIASVTGSMTPETFSTCNPKHPTPILQFHGTADNVVPYAGATWTHSIQEVMNYWVTYNQCDTESDTQDIPNTNTTDGSTVQHYVYDNGTHAVHTEHFKITGGGHTWAGFNSGQPATNYDIDASEEIWQFFNRYDINGLRSISTSVENKAMQSGATIFPNPVTATLMIEVDQSMEGKYTLFSITGQPLKTGTTRVGLNSIQMQDLPDGLYLLQVGQQLLRVVKH